MDINTSVRLTPDEEAQLIQVLGVDAAELSAQLANLGRAALREYADVLLGQVNLRSPEVREQRLLLLILEANQGRVPGEAEVSTLFNLPRAGARSLIRSVLSRYRLRLMLAVREAATQVLRDCGPEEAGARSVSIDNPVIVEHLNDLLAQLNGRLKRITRESKTGDRYAVPEDSYAALVGELQP